MVIYHDILDIYFELVIFFIITIKYFIEVHNEK